MRRTFILFVAISSAFGACSSESTNTGSSGAGGSTGGAAATGGSTSGGGSGGSAGAGSGGTAGQGGTGTDAGLGGSDGGGTDGGGTDGGVSKPPAKVACGTAAPSCPTNPGRCCFEVSKNSPVCQLEAAPCDPAQNTRILCDGSQDCASGEVCCLTKPLISPVDSGGYHPTAACAKACKPSPFPYTVQVCDLKQTSPTQCLTGSCKKVVHVGPPKPGETQTLTLPIGYGICE